MQDPEVFGSRSCAVSHFGRRSPRVTARHRGAPGARRELEPLEHLLRASIRRRPDLFRAGDQELEPDREARSV